MDLNRFLHQTRALLTDLEPLMTEGRVRSIRRSLDHGEEGIALNDLVAVLVKNEIPVSDAQRDTLHELIAYFGPLDDETLRHHIYLNDYTLNWLTVVEN